MEEEKKDGESAIVPDLSKPAESGPSVEDRVKGFNLDLREILGKHRMVLLAEPRIFNGVVVADPKVIPQEEYEKVTTPKPEEAIK